MVFNNAGFIVTGQSQSGKSCKAAYIGSSGSRILRAALGGDAPRKLPLQSHCKHSPHPLPLQQTHQQGNCRLAPFVPATAGLVSCRASKAALSSHRPLRASFQTLLLQCCVDAEEILIRVISIAMFAKEQRLADFGHVAQPLSTSFCL